MEQIADWLKKLGMSEYTERFAENHIDEGIICELTDQDLKDLGVVSLGHRRKLLRAIRELDEAAATVAATKSEPVSTTELIPEDAAERRQLTVMFCDLVGLTALSAPFDPEELKEVFAAYRHGCTDLIERNSGVVAKYPGDGVLAYFGYLEAREHGAEQAVRTGLDLVELVPQLGIAAGLSSQVRVGIATGFVAVGDLVGTDAAQEQAVGEMPNFAARLQDVAEPGTVVIAESTRKLLGNLFELDDLGLHELNCGSAPVRAFAVIPPSSVEGRERATTDEVANGDAAPSERHDRITDNVIRATEEVVRAADNVVRAMQEVAPAATSSGFSAAPELVGTEAAVSTQDASPMPARQVVQLPPLAPAPHSWIPSAVGYVVLAFAAGAVTSWLLAGGASKIHDQVALASPWGEIGKTAPTTREAARVRTRAAANARAFFVDLKDGATLPSKATIKFGLSGMEVAPAGAKTPNSGHFHLLIDTPLPALDREIPNDLNHLHFGKGQTEANVELSPGEHTLQLLLGDHLHVPHDPPVMSEVIHVHVPETRQVYANVPLVDALRLDSPAGIGVILLNWNDPQADQGPLPVTVFVAGAAGKKVMSVAGTPITTQTVGRDLNVTLLMKNVDILMIR